MRLTVKQLVCDSLYGMRIIQTILVIPLNTLEKNTGPLEGWELEHRIVEKSQARPAVDCGETALGEVMDEIVVENAFGGKPGSHGSKLILLSHA